MKRYKLTDDERAALDIDNLRAAGEANAKSACAEYGVKPADYGRDKKDFEGAWSDYEEHRVSSIMTRASDPEAVYQEAERLWIKRHRS